MALICGLCNVTCQLAGQRAGNRDATSSAAMVTLNTRKRRGLVRTRAICPPRSVQSVTEGSAITATTSAVITSGNMPAEGT